MLGLRTHCGPANPALHTQLQPIAPSRTQSHPVAPCWATAIACSTTTRLSRSPHLSLAGWLARLAPSIQPRTPARLSDVFSLFAFAHSTTDLHLVHPLSTGRSFIESPWLRSLEPASCKRRQLHHIQYHYDPTHTLSKELPAYQTFGASPGFSRLDLQPPMGRFPHLF